MGSSIALAAVSAAFAIQSAATVPPVPLQPTGPWNVEYADSMCILAREFGEGDAKVTLAFKPGLFSENMRIVLAQSRSSGRQDYGEARLAFDDGAPLKAQYGEAYLEDSGHQVLTIDLQQPDLAPLGTVRQLWVRAGKNEFLLAPTAVTAAMKALDTCQKHLLVTWGMAPAMIASIATFPKARAAYSMFSASDYPLNAFLKRQQGTSGVRFWVKKDGKVRDCQVVESSGTALLDNQACAVITKRGRYDPARTTGGEAVESISFQRVRWVLPYRP